MVGIWLLLGCFDTEPTKIQSPQDVPIALSKNKCPVDSVFVEEEKEHFCLDEVSEKRHGPSLSFTDEGRVFRIYKHGEEVEIPWFVDKSGELDLQKTQAFIHKDISLVLLQSAQERYPQDKDIKARLAQKGAMDPDTLFLNTSTPCTKAPAEMLCISGGGWVQRIYNDQDVHYRAFWLNRFFVDTGLVAKADVLRCQQDCRCPSGVWNSWEVAKAYCRVQGKRLLTENELWMTYGKDSSKVDIPKNRGFEWSADEFVSGGTKEEVLWNPQGKCVDQCFTHTQVSINKIRQSATKTASFRCGTTELDSLRTKNEPKRLSQLPFMEPVTQKWKSSWVHKNPKSMRTNLGTKATYQYVSGHQLAKILWAYHEENQAHSAVFELGRTHRDSPILALRIGLETASPKPSILIEGGHHGHELLSVLYALHSIDVLLEDMPKRLLEKYDFWFVPAVNMDGLEVKLFRDSTRQYGRKNGKNTDDSCLQNTHEGVDLNRNYPFHWGAHGERGSKSDPMSSYYRGETAASEPEVQSMMNLALSQHFVAALSFQTPGSSILVPYTSSRTKNPQPYVAWDIAEQISEGVGTLHNDTTYRVRNRRFYAEGTFQDWLFHQLGTMAFLIEGTEHNPETTPKIRDSVRATKKLLPLLMQELERRPTLQGIIQNERGEPVQASVKVRGYDVREGEVWKSRAKDGFFFRVLLDNGSYEVIVQADGYETLHQDCTVGENAPSCVLVVKSIF